VSRIGANALVMSLHLRRDALKILESTSL